MKAVLLVGGEGTRLRPLTSNMVKAMVPILNRPFLEHMVSYLKHYGVSDIVLAMCYLPHHIESHFGNGRSLGVNLTYVIEDTPLGTAGAVKNVEAHLSSEPFLVFNGDIFSDIDLQAMLAFHRSNQAKATIALTPVEDPSAYGVIETSGNGRVKQFIEKPKREEAPTNMINAGIYILEPDVLARVPAGQKYMFEHHLYPSLLADGLPVYGYKSSGYWIDIGTHDKYRQVQYDLLTGRGTSSLYTSGFEGDMGKGDRSVIDPGAMVEGAVLMGERCTVGVGARVLGPSVLGSHCTVAPGASIDRCILWARAQIGNSAVLEKCTIGAGAVIEDGASIGEGAVVGDGIRIPANSYIAPGSRVPALD